MNPYPDETVIWRERIHPGVFCLPALALIPSVLVGLMAVFWYSFMERMMAPLVQALGQMTPPNGARPLEGPFSMMAIAVGFLIFVSLLPGLSLLIVAWLAYLKSEIIVTNKRLLFQMGFFVRSSGELPLANVEGIFVIEPLLGRLLGYGTVAVTSLGGMTIPLHYIGVPLAFQMALQEAINEAKAPQKPGANRTSPPDDLRYMPKA